MFEHAVHQRRSKIGSAVQILELIYHSTVRSVRKSHGNAIIGLFVSILQTLILVLVFYFMFTILGLRGMTIRGDFLLYIMTGIFLFLTHNKAVTSVTSAEGPASPMMLHAPMNTAISITSSALASLYIQILALAVILFVYHVGFNRITFYEPAAAFGMLLLAWYTGVGVGLLFLALKPWMPGFVSVAQQIYTRANMVASGKMFVANTLPSSMVALFDWNPLFHCIDQARGYTFINYNPHFSSTTYPLVLGLVLMMIGLMGEFYTRKHVSVSWGAGK